MALILLCVGVGCSKDDEDTNNTPTVKTLSIEADAMTIEELPFEDDFKITSNDAWVVTTEEEWIHITPETGNGSKKVVLSADANVGSVREGEVLISLTDGTKSETLIISQDSNNLIGTWLCIDSADFYRAIFKNDGTFEWVESVGFVPAQYDGDYSFDADHIMIDPTTEPQFDLPYTWVSATVLEMDGLKFNKQ